MSNQNLKQGLLNNRFIQKFKRSAQKSRLLTTGETELARSIFGDSIHLNEVQLKTAWWVLKYYAVSPNGHIYFNPQNWINDFSKASLSKQGWLIHELTHVWQRQQGLKVVRSALLNRRYNYELQLGKSFFKYGIEQQARMVEDYFIRRQLGQNCADLAECIPFLNIQVDTNSRNNHRQK